MPEETQPTDNGGVTINQLVEVAESLAAYDTEIAEKERELAGLKSRRNDIAQRSLPDMMRSAGVRDLTLRDGRRVKLGEFYVGRLTDATRAAAFEWLEAHNCLGIVKDKVTVDFDRGHAEAANRVVEEMRALGVPVERKRDIHAQTLNKFVREQMAEHPDTFPQQLFNVAQVTEVKIS